MGFEQLREGVRLPTEDIEIPELIEVAIPVDAPPAIDDVEQRAHNLVVERFADHVAPRLTVAVGLGSRGLTGAVGLARGVIGGLRTIGADVFVVPAMGSHGGSDADGQRATLEHLGLTSEALGAEIRATMDTVAVATTTTCRPVFLDTFAAAADRILPVNRIKPHTSFHGPLESGLTKMAVVGFGKADGARVLHGGGPAQIPNRLAEGIDALRATGRLLGGVATLESAAGDVVAVEALDASGVGGAAEIALTERARSSLPTLPFDDIDVLIIERGGKDISGTTIDPNVTGRFWFDDGSTSRPRVGMIVLLALTDASAGNAMGIGFADFVPASVAAAIDWSTTYVNAFTTGVLGARRVRVPMVLPDEDACIRAALAMSGALGDTDDGAGARVVRIESTRHLTRAWVSPAVAAEPRRPR